MSVADGFESFMAVLDGARRLAGLMVRIALFGWNAVVVFGTTEYVAPIRLRLFHAGRTASLRWPTASRRTRKGARRGPRMPSTRRTCATWPGTSRRFEALLPGAPPPWELEMLI